MLRTHTCGELGIRHIGLFVTLCGWVSKIRNKGKIIWIDIRDRYGTTQLIFNKFLSKDFILKNKIKLINKEYVLKVNGIVIKKKIVILLLTILKLKLKI